MQLHFRTATLVALGLALTAASAQATLTPTVISDSQQVLQVVWNWTPEETDVSTPELANWDTRLAIALPETGTGGDAQVDFALNHVEDVLSGDDTPTLDLITAFNPGTDFGTVLDDTQLNRRDGCLTFVKVHFDRQPNPADSDFTVIATRVCNVATGGVGAGVASAPEPASMMLMGVGGLLILSRRWRRH